MFKLLEVLTSTGMPVAENITEDISTTTTTLSPSAEKISQFAEQSEEVVNNVVESNPVTVFLRDVITSPKFYVPVISIFFDVNSFSKSPIPTQINLIFGKFSAISLNSLGFF